MSQWNIIRKATEEDYERYRAAAYRFLKNRKYKYMDPEEPEFWVYIDLDIQNYLEGLRSWDHERYIRERQNWRKAVKRALKDKWAEGINYGYVGYYT